jgi:RHS repeat-associated protein
MNQSMLSPASRQTDRNERDGDKGVRITAASLEMPKGGGAIAGLSQRLEHNPFDGSAAFEIPIPTPVPRGVSPGLALRYASSTGNGPFGLGFDTAVPKFTRRSASFGIPRYDETDRFTHSEQGTLVDKLTNAGAIEQRMEPEDSPIWRVRSFLPRVEGSFSRIEQWQRLSDGVSHWIVQTNANQTNLYGGSEQARIYDPRAPARIAEWLLEETTDAHGNKIRYCYRAAEPGSEASGPKGAGHELTSNRYLSEVAFGNFEFGGGVHFNVRVVFDYGGHRGEAPGPEPAGTPDPRPDPFSVYTAGFEVRTIWRCRRLLVYTSHPELFVGAPVLTRSLTLTYDQGTTGLSLLTRVEQRGFRRVEDGSYVHEDLPPVTFGFTPFTPSQQQYRQLIVDDGGQIPGPLGEGEYLPVDLDGEGLPGILFSSRDQTLYWPPLGDGRYGAPVSPAWFPNFRDLGDPTLTLMSLGGDGRQQMVSSGRGRAGFFTLEPSGLAEPANATTRWAGFQPFEAVPSAYGTPAGTLVAMNGDGRLDFLETQAPTLRCYPSLGTRGFGVADMALMPDGYPPSPIGGPAQVDTYADMFGDGLSHRVRISQGRVECWPDLGYGAFGTKVTLADAPRYGGGLDASRLFLADLDGSGPADLIYVTSDALLIHFNRSGNGFSEPLLLPLPVPFDSASQISFSDIYGNGAACLVLTRLHPEVTHYVYDFSGGTKPYLLTTIDDAMGCETRCAYTTSVQQYLRDKRAGNSWITQTYFPVQIVAEIETVDRIAEARNIQRFAYHDGYYDPALRQFQGFGYIESWDSETFAERQDAIRAGRRDLDPLSLPLWTPTAYTRAWFHTGAFLEAEAIARRNRANFWHGDADAPELPEQWIAPEIDGAGTSVLRQAYAALGGHALRREVYGLDEESDAAAPYSVFQATTGVRLIQPKGPNPNAVVQAFVREQITAQYERDGADPRIAHEFQLRQDPYGDVTRSCAVAYPRRPGPAGGPLPYPEQEEICVTFRNYAYIVHPGDASAPFRWIGQQVEEWAFEIAGAAPAGRYFTFDEIDTQYEQALAHQIPYGQPFEPGAREARLFQWTRGYYWDAEQSAPLRLGEIAALGLAHHGEAAVMTPALVEEAFGSAAPPAMLEAGGYALADGYWWDRGLIQYYETRAGGFSQPCRTDGRFPGVPEDSPLNPTTIVTYDAAALFVTSVSRLGSALAGPVGPAGAVVLTSTVKTDYQSGQPASITDPNGTSTEMCYSPLGLIVATAVLGAIEGKPAGDLPLDTRVPTPVPSLAAIVAQPEAFLQGSTSYFHYDLLAWTARREPTAVIEVTRQLHVRQLKADQTSPLPIIVTYRDGSGRDVETRIDYGPEPDGERHRQSEPAARRWAVSGRVRLDNKGLPVEAYLAYFAATPYYGDNLPLGGELPPPDVMHYDALGRLVQETTSKGFLRRESYGAWMATSWDENDTVLQSPFYKSFPSDPKTPEQKREAAALRQAVRCTNTPTRTCLDPAGGTIRTLAANLGAITPDTLAPAVVGKPITAQELWDRLVADGYLAPAAEIPGAAWATPLLQPYLPAFQQRFAEQYDVVAAPTLEILKETGLATHTELDIQGRITRLSDPRLFYAAVTGASIAVNFSFMLDMAGNQLRTVSADAGTRRVLTDIFGNEMLSIDGRGVELVTQYDRLLRPVRVDTSEPDGAARRTRCAQLFVYGEAHPDAAARNLKGQVWQGFDDAGLETSDLYDLAGNALTLARRVRDDHAAPADWTPAAIAAVEQQEAFVTGLEFDAEQARIVERTPDGSVTHFAYDLAGLIARINVLASGETEARTIVDQARYNAVGQRLRIAYGNGVITETSYEPRTQRPAVVTSANAQAKMLQDVVYTYDPVGNVTDKVDRSWETVFCFNQQVDPASNYDYDPLYRLRRATGRQQAGAGARSGGKQPGAMPFCPADPADRQQLENYVEEFAYDAGGNMVRLRHSAPRASWTTELPVDPTSNRLLDVRYDPAGNQQALGASPLRWNYRGWLAAATLVERESDDGDTEHYLYDASGVRVLRVTRRLKSAAAGSQPALYELRETLYLENYERTRTFQESGAGPAVSFTTTEALAIPDDNAHLCVLERDTSQAKTRRAAASGQWQGRFLLDNQVASVTQELDQAGARIVYREYYPYGATAFVAEASAGDAETSKFRFAGKRRDDATGLYYFGMRYYPPWLARWISTDPAGTVDGPNLYAYVQGNPASFTDEAGLGKVKTDFVFMHGKKVKKPEKHAGLHPKSEKVGQMIAEEIVASSTDHKARLKLLEKDIVGIQKSAGLPVHDETKVDEAMKAGMRGDKDTFDRLYRAALPGMDEQISTATMYYIAKGAGKVKMNEAQWKQFAYSFRIASRLRLETEYSGHAVGSAVVQHPTRVGSEFFGSSGKGHTYWDRARREDAVGFGLTTSSTGVDRMLGMVAEAGRHSLSYGVAPSRARNVLLQGGISKKSARRQMRHREGVKRIVLRLQGKDLSIYATQKGKASWVASRTAPPSPLRRGYY